MSDDTDLARAERTYLTQLDSHLRDLDRSDRDLLVAEVATELRTKPAASDLDALVADIGEPARRAAELRVGHDLPPARPRATATFVGLVLLAVAALGAAGLAASWWLTYEAELGVEGFAAGYGDILDPTGIEPRSDGDRDQLLVGYRPDEQLEVLVEITNLDSRSITITSVDIDDELVDLVDARWRWTAPTLPADVGPIDDVELEPDGDRRTIRLLLSFTFAGCESVAAGETTVVSSVVVHYETLGRDRTNAVELPVDLVPVSPPDEACPARS